MDPIDFFLERETARDARDAQAEAWAASWNWRRFRQTNVFDSDDEGNISIELDGAIKVSHTRIPRGNFGSDAEHLEALWLFLWDRGALQEECRRIGEITAAGAEAIELIRREIRHITKTLDGQPGDYAPVPPARMEDLPARRQWLQQELATCSTRRNTNTLPPMVKGAGASS